MPNPILILGGLAAGAVVLGGDKTIHGGRIPIKTKTLEDDLILAKKTVVPDDPNEFEDQFSPQWLHSDGCKTLYWGLCFKDFSDALVRYGVHRGYSGSEATEKAIEVLRWIFLLINPAGVALGDWITQNVCIRFDFRVRRYTTDASMGNKQLFSLTGVQSAFQFDQWVPQQHPLEYLEDEGNWKRVWMRRYPFEDPEAEWSDGGPWEVIWPDDRGKEGGITMQRLASWQDIKLALLYTWATISPDTLPDPGCGDSKWLLTKRDNALRYFETIV
jgi:sarcosine oxidase delta subunit